MLLLLMLETPPAVSAAWARRLVTGMLGARVSKIGESCWSNKLALVSCTAIGRFSAVVVAEMPPTCMYCACTVGTLSNLCRQSFACLVVWTFSCEMAPYA